jgi:hypothetical protein
VGHNGEWFVKWIYGIHAWHCVHPPLSELQGCNVGSTLRNRTGNVQWVELGPDSTFVAQFEKYTAWYGSKALTEALLTCV